MTKCKRCGKEFDAVKEEHSKEHDRGDGVMYGSSSWSHTPVCPHCGCNNDNTKVIL